MKKEIKFENGYRYNPNTQVLTNGNVVINNVNTIYEEELIKFVEILHDVFGSTEIEIDESELIEIPLYREKIERLSFEYLISKCEQNESINISLYYPSILIDYSIMLSYCNGYISVDNGEGYIECDIFNIDLSKKLYALLKERGYRIDFGGTFNMKPNCFNLN